jgi:hypothetical protein
MPWSKDGGRVPNFGGEPMASRKGRGISLPLDSSKRGFKHVAAAKFFPFKEVDLMKVKMKEILIELH